MIEESHYRKIILLCAGGIIFFLFIWLISPSGDSLPIIFVAEGKSLNEIAQDLDYQSAIRSPLIFKTFAILFGGQRKMKAGEYSFEPPQNTILLAWRIRQGDHRIRTIKLTIPEGFTVKKISALFDSRFAFFDNDAFEMIAPEGYLFPDTYFLPITATATSTVKLLRDNFIRKIFPVMPEVELSKKSLEEIIIMASLIEGEANNQEDRELVSAILWKRLKLGMPLQVDVEMKTYEFLGLPEKPINNPGILSIQAALHPTTTPYLYYLTGDDGNMYYSKTFEEHVAKKHQYIK